MLEIFILWIIGFLYVCGTYYALETTVSTSKGEAFNTQEALQIMAISLFIWPAVLGVIHVREFLFEKDLLLDEKESDDGQSI